MIVSATAPLDDWTAFARATKLKAALLKKVRPFITEKDSTAQPIDGEADAELRDTEIVPFTYDGGIEAFIENEVRPYAADAYVDEKKTQIGYEISFTKYFYKPTELRPIDWMEGSGLSYIMQRAIDYHKQHPENFWVSAYQPPTIYNDHSKEHRNVVFADTLEAIENIVLFSISNYFLRFSNEYKKIHGVDEFDNNWYEYVEFGTTNPLTILLQRNGFSRESATFIKKHKNEYVAHDGSTDELRLRLSLLNCGNTSVMTEAASIRFNAPKLFLEED